ncbi:Ig-like domain-containing protein [Pseudomonas hormoni]|uniref:Ig-like domain-containing protein n=1 Tax=Pseudomonas hormoni TaxID=3093767 RepID=A0ABX8F6Z3_9PSED|nr:Ig-like domain-containing protein [Pseudomonas hormoni]
MSTVAVTGVSVAPKNSSVVVGSTRNISATVSPSNATDKSVTWESSNPAVASVSASGVATGLTAGTTSITGTTKDGSFSDACTLTVTA